MEKVNIDQKKPSIIKLAISFTTYSSGPNSVMNITYQLYEAIENIKVEIRFCFPESNHDDKYLREIFRTSIDMGKTVKSLKTNFLVQDAITKFLESLNGTSEFPLPVGIYQFTNLTFDGSLLPPISSKYLVVAKVFIKTLKTNGKFVFTNLVKVYSKLN